MNRGPMPGRQSPVDYLAKAQMAWKPAAPSWIEALAAECNRTTASATAALIGYAPSSISQVISNTYRGDLGAIEAKVRGALMGATVGCPVLGEIGLDQCKTEQSTPFVATNSTRAQLRRACRSCPNKERTS